MPIVGQLTREIERLLELRLGNERLAVSHCARHNRRDLRKFFQLGYVEFHFCHACCPLPGSLFQLARPVHDMALLARIVHLITGGAKEDAGRM